jgi:hypothetical protein
MPEKCTSCPTLKCPLIARLRCPAQLKVQSRGSPVYSWHRWGDRARREGLWDVDSKIAGLWARILRAGAVQPLTMVALLLAGSTALAQENRGTEQQRVACAPDVLRLCFWEIPNTDRIVACLRREKSQLSAGCRQAFEIDGRGG